MVKPVRLFLDNRQLWLPCSSPTLVPGLPLPCVDGIWLVVLVRVLPSVLICLVDLALIYQVGDHASVLGTQPCLVLLYK